MSNRRPSPLTSSILFACALAAPFLAKADDGGGGTGNPPTLEEQLTAARNDLTASQTNLSTLTSERDTARTDLAAAQSEVTRLTSQFNELTTTANQLRTDLTAAQSQVTTLTGERDTARTDLTAANTNVSRLESLCGVKGIDPKEAVPAQNQAASANAVFAEYQRLRQTDTLKAQSYYREHREELESLIG